MSSRSDPSFIHLTNHLFLRYYTVISRWARNYRINFAVGCNTEVSSFLKLVYENFAWRLEVSIVEVRLQNLCFSILLFLLFLSCKQCPQGEQIKLAKNLFVNWIIHTAICTYNHEMCWELDVCFFSISSTKL